ncbi:hypothetical protein D2E26_0335 [Bifidobacterium dolichotidis]|uniref:Uncharacterized protein n=1 Tax=Bifidobacterium dolichotidis TaxID=2306976 RepID=A0A430FSA2_9BIFI|nr:hypothetical protein D2E26_0335 [Bifidobacterium dolichotidis]
MLRDSAAALELTGTVSKGMCDAVPVGMSRIEILEWMLVEMLVEIFVEDIVETRRLVNLGRFVCFAEIIE